MRSKVNIWRSMDECRIKKADIFKSFLFEKKNVFTYLKWYRPLAVDGAQSPGHGFVFCRFWHTQTQLQK